MLSTWKVQVGVSVPPAQAMLSLLPVSANCTVAFPPAGTLTVPEGITLSVKQGLPGVVIKSKNAGVPLELLICTSDDTELVSSKSDVLTSSVSPPVITHVRAPVLAPSHATTARDIGLEGAAFKAMVKILAPVSQITAPQAPRKRDVAIKAQPILVLAFLLMVFLSLPFRATS